MLRERFVLDIGAVLRNGVEVSVKIAAECLATDDRDDAIQVVDELRSVVENVINEFGQVRYLN
jgi:hypothetical protein